jgi:hypothetical protein
VSRMRRTRWLGAVAIALGALVGCGVDDLRVHVIGGAGPDGAGSTGGGDDATAMDGSTDDGSQGTCRSGCGDADTNDSGPGLSLDAEPACAGGACVAPPAGWIGPVALWEGSPASAPLCSDVSGVDAFDAFGGPVSAATTGCPTCGCSVGSGAYCKAVVGETDAYSAPGTCNGGADTLTFLTAGCQSTGASSGTGYISNATASAVGTCTASTTGTATLPTPSWHTAARGCAFARGTCTSGACAASPNAPFMSGVCVYQNAAASCPPGFPASHTYYTGATDTRGCAGCACTYSATCTASLAIYAASGAPCTSTELRTTLMTPQSCYTAWTYGSMNVTFTGPIGASCAPSGGQATGLLTPSGPMTVCCTQ